MLALERLPALPEWQDAAWLKRNAYPSFADALAPLHRPTRRRISNRTSPAWSRLAYDELLASQLALALLRAHMRPRAGRGSAAEGLLRARIVNALPYSLTPSQDRAVADIIADLAQPAAHAAAPARRRRLGQDGGGAACRRACDRGRTAGGVHGADRNFGAAAFRHHRAARRGRRAPARHPHRPRARPRARRHSRSLAAGDIDLIVGTHALFQENVAFRDLALAIVDEQHRFGVHQRLALARKGEAVDLLVLTATPIPRTLVLTYFGDMDISELREKPAGRQKIDTRAVPLDRLAEVIEAVARALDAGRRVYWVCPLVEESESIDLAAAEDRYEALQKRFGDVVDIVHGRMRGPDKDRAMARFAKGETRLLVATTVIEVGVDVPEASVMVIEHAERFGLAQLHQLRGRIGRGAERSTCILLYKRAARRDRQGAARHLARDRGRLPHRRGGFQAAWRRRPARHAAERRAGLPHRAARISRQAPWRGARRRDADPVARSEAKIAARRRRCAICSICSPATRRSGCWTRDKAAGWRG